VGFVEELALIPTRCGKAKNTDFSRYKNAKTSSSEV
jgi:hypothetical protein